MSLLDHPDYLKGEFCNYIQRLKKPSWIIGSIVFIGALFAFGTQMAEESDDWWKYGLGMSGFAIFILQLAQETGLILAGEGKWKATSVEPYPGPKATVAGLVLLPVLGFIGMALFATQFVDFDLEKKGWWIAATVWGGVLAGHALARANTVLAPALGENRALLLSTEGGSPPTPAGGEIPDATINASVFALFG